MNEYQWYKDSIPSSAEYTCRKKRINLLLAAWNCQNIPRKREFAIRCKLDRNKETKYTDKNVIPNIPIDIIVENNYPLPEDVQEEKTMDITEVEANVMSRKSYLKKWRKLNDEEADKELLQIQKEKQMLEESYIDYNENDLVDINEDINQEE